MRQSSSPGGAQGPNNETDLFVPGRGGAQSVALGWYTVSRWDTGRRKDEGWTMGQTSSVLPAVDPGPGRHLAGTWQALLDALHWALEHHPVEQAQRADSHIDRAAAQPFPVQTHEVVTDLPVIELVRRESVMTAQSRHRPDIRLVGALRIAPEGQQPDELSA